MSTVSVLILTKFRKTAERAVVWLMTSSYQALFLDLPENLVPFVTAYVEGKISQEELWMNYGFLTELQEPFINALRYRMDPILRVLPWLQKSVPRLEVYCYQDLGSHIEASELSERLLLLEMRERIQRRIRLGEWRQLLQDESHLANEELMRTVETLVEAAGQHSESAVLYSGFVKPLKACLETRGFRVHSYHLHSYWRNPLDVLRIMTWMHGVDGVPAALIRNCITCHLNYLNYILSSQDVDGAHEVWSLERRPYPLN